MNIFTGECYVLCVDFFCVFFMNMRCVRLFFGMARELVCVCVCVFFTFFFCSVGFAAFPLTDDCGAKRLHEFHRYSEKCGQHPNGDKTHDTVGNRVEGREGHQPTATRTGTTPG